MAATGIPVRRPGRGMRRRIARVARAVAPLELPSALRAFWRAFDPSCLRVVPVPRPVSPEFALECWRGQQTGQRSVPPALFPVGFEGGELLLVELHDASRRGGACFRWAYGGGPFEMTFLDLTGYLDLLATMILHQEFDGEGRVEVGRWQDAAAVRLAANLPHPVHGTSLVVPQDITQWPERWLGLGVQP